MPEGDVPDTRAGCRLGHGQAQRRPTVPEHFGSPVGRVRRWTGRHRSSLTGAVNRNHHLTNSWDALTEPGRAWGERGKRPADTQVSGQLVQTGRQFAAIDVRPAAAPGRSTGQSRWGAFRTPFSCGVALLRSTATGRDGRALFRGHPGLPGRDPRHAAVPIAGERRMGEWCDLQGMPCAGATAVGREPLDSGPVNVHNDKHAPIV